MIIYGVLDESGELVGTYESLAEAEFIANETAGEIVLLDKE